MAEDTTRPAEEFFYLDGGTKQDAELHNAIINPVDYPIDEKIMGPIRARNRAAYLDQQQAKTRLLRWIRVKAKAQARLAKGQNGLYKVWNEDDHPRAPAGGPDGGEFVGGGGGGSEDSRPPDATGTGAAGRTDGRLPRAFSRESSSDAERGRGVVSVYRPTPIGEAKIRAAGNTPQTFHELGGDEGAKTFNAAIASAKASAKFGAAVHVYEPDEYKGMRLFLTPDGKNGFALKGDDIVSLFKNSNAAGVAGVSLKLATEQGGRRLDAFDTALPFIYAKAGFTPVARLKWNETYKPDGWDKATFKEFNHGEPDVVFMTYSGPSRQTYTPGASPYVNDYDAGTAAQLKSQPSVQGYTPGVRGRGKIEIENRRADWVEASPVKTIDHVIAAAPIAQKNFAETGERIAKEMGIEFKNPGPKTSSAKGIARTEQKIAERNGVAARVTDTARGAFILDKPEQADTVIAKLARTHEILAEPWRTIPETYYTDRALLFRDRQTGLIGEVQLTEPAMAAAKKIGHQLYEQSRSLPALIDGKPNPQVAELEAKQRAIYGPVLDGYKGTPWGIVDGRSRGL